MYTCVCPYIYVCVHGKEKNLNNWKNILSEIPVWMPEQKILQNPFKTVTVYAVTVRGKLKQLLFVSIDFYYLFIFLVAFKQLHGMPMAAFLYQRLCNLLWGSDQQAASWAGC